MSAESNDMQASAVYYEDWIGGEPVTVVDTVLPNNVTNLEASNIQASSLTLSWTASTSPEVTGYEIYNGSTSIGTTNGTSYQVNGLSGETTYTFTVKTRSASGNVSSGTSLTVTTPVLTYALSMNGTSDYVYTPTLSFDTVIMDITMQPKASSYTAAYLDASRGIQNAAFLHNGSGFDVIQAAWKSLLVDGVDKTGAAGSSAVIPAQQRVTVQLVLHTPGRSSLYIFANQLGNIPMKGILYSIKVLLNGSVVAAYDFTQQSTGTAIPDRSGNNQTATLKGGTWISQ